MRISDLRGTTPALENSIIGSRYNYIRRVQRTVKTESQGAGGGVGALLCRGVSRLLSVQEMLLHAVPEISPHTTRCVKEWARVHPLALSGLQPLEQRFAESRFRMLTSGTTLYLLDISSFRSEWQSDHSCSPKPMHPPNVERWKSDPSFVRTALPRHLHMRMRLPG